MPGVSSIRPPPGARNNSRVTVVCRPRLSAARLSRVAWISWPGNRLTSVDLPTPLEPTNATVRPVRMYAASHPRSASFNALQIYTGASPETAIARICSSRASAQTSALFNNTIASGPPARGIFLSADEGRELRREVRVPSPVFKVRRSLHACSPRCFNGTFTLLSRLILTYRPSRLYGWNMSAERITE